jgi:hypothetical protein
MRAGNKAQGQAARQGSCAACEVEGQEGSVRSRWGNGGVPLCNRHYQRWKDWKSGHVQGGASKLEAALELAMAVLQKREAIDLTYSTDSVVEVVE